MIISITPKEKSTTRSNIGEYRVLKKELELWINSSSLILGETDITIPDFDFPKDVEKLYIIDTNAHNLKLTIPVNEFKHYFVENEGYRFNYQDFVNKYKRVGIPNQVL